MSASITVRLFGNPVAQGRPRAARKGNMVFMYDPAPSRKWKKDVALQTRLAMAAKGAKMLSGPLVGHIEFFLKRPKSLPKRTVYHVKKPDLDNCLKGLIDALQGIMYENDSSIVRLHIGKQYEDKEEKPGVKIEFYQLEGGE